MNSVGIAAKGSS